MTDERRDERLHGLTEDYNAPTGTPREEIWARIEARLGEREWGVARWRRPGRRPWLAAGVGIAAAALLVLGVGLGRVTAPGAPGGAGTLHGPMGDAVAGALADEEEGAADRAVRFLALEHLGRAEPLLSAVRVDARQGHLDREVGEWGRDLLTETRLLLDSPSTALDPSLRTLLRDLELILVQVALLSEGGAAGGEWGREELRLIADGLDEQDVMARIQAALPAGPGLTSM